MGVGPYRLLVLRVLLACSLAVATGCHLLQDYRSLKAGVDSRDGASPADGDVLGPGDGTDGEVAADELGPDGSDARPANQCLPEFDRSDTYRVQRGSTSSMTIDGRCGGDEFRQGKAYEIRFADPGTTTGEPVNTSDDNDGVCRFRWIPGPEDQLHGCCRIQDDRIDATTEQSDPEEDIYRTDDDRLEYWMKCDTRTSRSANCSYKVFMNPLSNGERTDFGPPTFFTRVHQPQKGGSFEAWNPATKARFRRTADGYVLEWRTSIGFAVQAGGTGRCQVAVFDTDGTDTKGGMYAFGPQGSVNEPSEWGCCFFE